MEPEDCMATVSGKSTNDVVIRLIISKLLIYVQAKTVWEALKSDRNQTKLQEQEDMKEVTEKETLTFTIKKKSSRCRNKSPRAPINCRDADYNVLNK